MATALQKHFSFPLTQEKKEKKTANLLSLLLEGHEISEESHSLPFSSRDKSCSCGISDTSSKFVSHVA